MKTVQDYLDLGLVFVDSDKLRSSTNNKDDKEVCMSGLCIAHKRYCDGFRGGNAIFFYASEWIPSSFAWRNNDGVKPEYNGLIHAMFENGVIIQDFADSLSWGSSFNSIIQWRPVVSMRNHTELKPRHSFVTAISIDSPKFTVKEEKPKTTTTVNIEGRDYILVSHKPAASPKEDKPMKPSYTAEMHAKGELPPVGAECEALCMDATNSKHVWTKAKILMNHEGNECAVYCVDAGVLRWADEFRLIPKTIKVNGFDIHAPMSEAPEHRQMVYLAHAAHLDFNLDFTWQGDDAAASWLSRGLIHSTKSAAIAHAKAMLGIDPNA